MSKEVEAEMALTTARLLEECRKHPPQLVIQALSVGCALQAREEGMTIEETVEAVVTAIAHVFSIKPSSIQVRILTRGSLPRSVRMRTRRRNGLRRIRNRKERKR